MDATSPAIERTVGSASEGSSGAVRLRMRLVAPLGTQVTKRLPMARPQTCDGVGSAPATAVPGPGGTTVGAGPT